MLDKVSVAFTCTSSSRMDVHTVSRILHSKARFISMLQIDPMQWGRACLLHVLGISVGRHDITLQVSILPTAESQLGPDHRVGRCGVEHCNKRCDQSKDAEEGVACVS